MLILLQLLLSEIAAHHPVAVLVNAIGEVLATFQEKFLNPIDVLTRTLLTPMHPLAFVFLGFSMTTKQSETEA